MNDNDKREFKLKLSRILFSLYPFIHNFKGYTREKVKYTDVKGVIINEEKFSDIKSLTSNSIIALASVDPNRSDDMKIEADINLTEKIKKENEIYRFQLFIHNFINIIKYQYGSYSKNFDEIYKIYYHYIKNKANLNSFKSTFKTDQTDQGIGIVMFEFTKFKKFIESYNNYLNDINNATIQDESLLKKSLFQDDNDNLYLFKDFIDYLKEIYKELNKEFESFSTNFASQINILSESIALNSKSKRTGIEGRLQDTFISKLKEGFDIETVRDTQDIRSIYSKAQSIINSYINKDSFDDDVRYKKIKSLSQKDKSNLKLTLANFFNLLDTNTGRWNSDIVKSGDYREDLQQLQYDFTTILQLLDYTKVEVKADYYEVKKSYDKLKSISGLILNKKRIPKEDYDFITNFDQVLGELENDLQYKDDDNYKQEIKKVKALYKELTTGSKAIITDEKLKEAEIIRKDTVYFDTNIIIFKLILKYLVMFAVLLLLVVVLLSIISLFILIWDIINYLIKSFINPNLTKAFTIDYLTKNMIHCNKNNYIDDRYLIFSVQSQNLSIFTLSAYILYLLLALLIFYLMHVLYATSSRKFLKGSIYDIDKEGGIIIIFIIILGYTVFHLFLYKIIFKPFVYTQYKDYEEREKKVEILLDDYILIKGNKTGSESEIIVDTYFFEVLIDATRIDELNNIFLTGVKDKNSSGCLEQKLLIYDIYIYLKEYISFDEKNQQMFIDYCTNNGENKPKDEETGKKITFLSMLNNSEVRMIKKYHEELEFYQNIPDNVIEYYNELNKNLSKKLKEINENIITYNKTLVPFFTTIIYIFVIFFITVGFFYLVITYVLVGDAKMSEENKFNYYFVYILYTIKTQIYDKIINWLYK